MNTVIIRIISLTLIFFLAGVNITTLPTGTHSAFAFSIGEEREYGDKLLTQVRKEFILLEEPDIVQYINQLGTEILAVAGPQYFTYHFFVVDNKEFNAFAAPAGLVFFHSGLIKAMDHENELVSVMAHEVGHATSRHIAESQEKAFKNNLLMLPFLIGGIALGEGALSQGLIYGSMAAGTSLSLKYSRHHEEESDRLALQWMMEMGRDPQGMVTMLQKMRRISLFQSSGQTPPYLLTHPEPTIRMGYAQDFNLFNEQREYREINNFNFLRFKCRVLAMTEEAKFLYNLYQSKISSPREQHTEAIMAHYGLSLYYRHEKEFAKAKASLRKVMKYYPLNSDLLADMGMIAFEEGQHTKALRFLERAQQTSPNSVYVNYCLALILNKTGNTDRAALLYEFVVNELPDYQPAYYELGRLKTSSGEEGVGHYYLGVFFWLKGDQRLARFHFTRALSLLDSQNSFSVKALDMLIKIQRSKKTTS